MQGISNKQSATNRNSETEKGVASGAETVKQVRNSGAETGQRAETGVASEMGFESKAQFGHLSGRQETEPALKALVRSSRVVSRPRMGWR